MSVRTFGASAVLAGGAAVAAAFIGAGAACADADADQINGWTVTPNGTDHIFANATLSDPSDSLGLGTSPIEGSWLTTSPSYLSSIGSNDQFSTPISTLFTPDNLYISNAWAPGFELASVQTGNGADLGSTNALLVPAHDGKEVVDLFQLSSPHDAPPLFNPDATGPIDVGGLELASPHDGALLNDLFDAVFKGDTADWGKAEALFDDWTGIDPSGATEAVDPSSWLPDLGL